MLLLFILLPLVALVFLFILFVQPILESANNLPATVYNHVYLEPCTSSESSTQNGFLKHARRHLFPSLFDQPSVKLSVIVPAYNEEARLKTMMDETMRYLKALEKDSISQTRHHDYNSAHIFTYEVIIVDDGSKDKTAEVAMKFVEKFGVEKVRLLRLYVNQGKGGAVQQGMLHARGELLLMVDADGATRFSDLKQLLNAFEEIPLNVRDYGICVGSRALEKDGDSSAERSPLRKLLQVGFHLLVSFLCVKGVKDTQCGFKLFARKAALVLFVNQKLRRWSFDVELLFMAQQKHFPIREVAVNWQEIPGSKVSVVGASIRMARDLLLIRFAYASKIWSILSPSAFSDHLRTIVQ